MIIKTSDEIEYDQRQEMKEHFKKMRIELIKKDQENLKKQLDMSSNYGQPNAVSSKSLSIMKSLL